MTTKTVDKKQIESEAVKRFEWLVSFLIIRFRFVHQILGMMYKIPYDKVETMGVRVTEAGKFELRYNPVWTMSLTDAAATYVFYHEILHLVFHHCTSRKFSNHKIGNIAQDLAINELIPITIGICEPPVDDKGERIGCFVSEMKKEPEYKDIEDKKSAEWYYDYLMKKAKDQKKGKGGKEIGNGSFDDHGGWGENEIADERIAAKVKEIQNGDTWGNVSQGTREMILAAQTKKINWRNLIRVWFGNIAWKDRHYTRKKPNRRTGFIHPGTRKAYVNRWLVAIDTSGSVDAELLALFLGVLNQLADELPIDIMMFDWAKTDGPRPFDRRQLSLEFMGRGGTNFQPVMDIVEQQRYKGVMILTDGEASEPTKPRLARVLWVCPEGKNPPCEWGTTVHMQKHV